MVVDTQAASHPKTHSSVRHTLVSSNKGETATVSLALPRFVWKTSVEVISGSRSIGQSDHHPQAAQHCLNEAVWFEEMYYDLPVAVDIVHCDVGTNWYAIGNGILA